MVCIGVVLLRWTPVIWITLLTHSVVCLLPAPVDVSVTSLNLEHTLTWTPGRHTPPHTRYRVQYSSNSSWSSVWACQELLSSESCDLTALLGDPLETYRLRLQAFNPAHNPHHQDQSTWSQAKPFCPVTDTVFGPPLLEVSGCGACLRLHIRPPASRWQHLQENSSSSSSHRPLLFYYSKLQAQLTRTRDNSQFSVAVQSGENVIGYLEPGAEYCVTVVTVTHFGSHALPSQAHCTHTSPTPINTVPESKPFVSHSVSILSTSDHRLVKCEDVSLIFAMN
ncbi:interferon alpha/beta receptor 2-like [Engraulis encrasicolus]|uniref:interferon alpha/beta receptor 2-like n=1 Tax=Engraulis encrasicolus TaxID=184585 RepID=UPI002FD3C408